MSVELCMTCGALRDLSEGPAVHPAAHSEKPLCSANSHVWPSDRILLVCGKCRRQAYADDVSDMMVPEGAREESCGPGDHAWLVDGESLDEVAAETTTPCVSCGGRMPNGMPCIRSPRGARHLSCSAPPETKAPESTTKRSGSPVSEAIRAEVLRLAAEGDKKEGGAFTANIATRIGRIMAAGRRLLLAERMGIGDARSLVGRRRRRNHKMMQMGYGSTDDMDEFDSMDPYDEVMNGPITESSSSENFGMHMMRERMAAAGKLTARKPARDPEKIVTSIAQTRMQAAEAEKAGKPDLKKVLDDLAERLTAELMAPAPESVSLLRGRPPGIKKIGGGYVVADIDSSVDGDEDDLGNDLGEVQDLLVGSDFNGGA